MSFFSYKYFSLLLHLLLWGIAFLFPYLVSDSAHQYKIGPLPGYYFTSSGVVHVFIFYLNAFFLYPKMMHKGYWPFYVIAAILLILLSYWVKYYILLCWFPDSFEEAKSHMLFPSLLIFCISIFYSITKEKIIWERQQKENKAMQLETELKLLRSQINPHFLFNILTNLVFLARKKSDKLETSLLKLSGLMRYMIHNTGEKIPVETEADYLQSYISLQQLRFGEEVSITCAILLEGEKDFFIETMLLIPFVENAFKYGADFPHQPFIEVSLTTDKDVLMFDVKNKFDPDAANNKDESLGIGLNNVRSRLELLYPGKHKLDIETHSNLFHVRLNLMLS